MAKEQLTFQKIDVDSLDSDQFAAFKAYLQAKADFRAALQSVAPEGHKVVFTEKYGTIDNPHGATLKVALVKAGKAKAKDGAKSLSDWLDAQDNAGVAR